LDIPYDQEDQEIGAEKIRRGCSYNKIQYMIHQPEWRDADHDLVKKYDKFPIGNKKRFSSICNFHNIRIFS